MQGCNIGMSHCNQVASLQCWCITSQEHDQHEERPAVQCRVDTAYSLIKLPGVREWANFICVQLDLVVHFIFVI